MAARGNDRQAARARARERRLQLDADRREREERVDEAVTDFELASADRAAALAAVTAAEISMGRAVSAMLGEGESMERAASLCDVTVTEVRRLAKLADRAGSGDDGPEDTAGAAKTPPAKTGSADADAA